MTQLDIYATGEQFDAIKRVDANGRETWSARDLMPRLEYGADWRNFADVVSRAKAACVNSGHAVQDHFVDATKMVPIGSGAHRSVPDFILTRYGAYLVAMNGDPRKPAVAGAQTYFAVKAREAEVAVQDTNPRHAIPATFAEALRRYADEVEAHEQTRAQLEIAGPKAAAWDTLAAKNGDMSVRRAAFCLNRDPNISTGQNRLFRWLRDNEWIDRKNVPYAAHEKHVRLRMYTHEGHDKQQVRVTVQGVALLLRRLGGTTPIADLVTQADVDGED